MIRYLTLLCLWIPFVLIACQEEDVEEIEGDEAGECDDGVDNDQDGATDCDDEGCVNATMCTGDDDDATSDDDDATPGDDDDATPGDDDDATPGDDDDATPGDDDDATPGDDDDSVGDDDDVTPPAWTQQFDYNFMANGAGGAGFVFTQTIYDDTDTLVCTTTAGGNADTFFGAGPGLQYYPYIDELISWLTTPGEVEESDSDCGDVGVIPYQGVVADGFHGTAWPLGVISCDYIDDEPSLAALFLGDDVFFGVGDGTFGSYCTDVGNYAELQYGTGPVEGIWLAPGSVGMIDHLGGTFEYFVPADNTTYASWMVKGLLMAASGNVYEPGPYLGEDDYVTVEFWQHGFTP